MVNKEAFFSVKLRASLYFKNINFHVLCDSLNDSVVDLYVLDKKDNTGT